MHTKYAVSAIVVRSIKDSVMQQRLVTTQEVNEVLDSCIAAIEEKRDILCQLVKDSNGCEHEFSPPTYTVQKRLLGYVTVYERQCSCCGFTDTHTVCEGEPLPAWTKNASKQYYNNLF